MNRITAVRQHNRDELHIRAPKRWWIMFFLPLWWVGWIALGSGAIVQTIPRLSPTERWFFPVWIIFWLAAAIFTAYVWLWAMFGREIVTVEQGMLRIQRALFNRGPTKQFSLTAMTNLRATGWFGPFMSRSFDLSYWGLSGGTVAFDYQGGTVRFGIQLDEREAHDLVERLRAMLPPT